ncbi:MAG: hypothetical protein K2N85_04880 [Lachnospiraceae bacterium]|nr:hypothetical protein [Lachnospiraceae bacterium]
MIRTPAVSLKADDNSVKADIYIVVQSHFVKLGQERNPIGSDSVILNRYAGGSGTERRR